ncbi:MAG TPA: DUF882 domain-containing protein [Caulobacterales bacterium]|nr:DUF882 domain-containing protein [Caulobacterales bacterium]
MHRRDVFKFAAQVALGAGALSAGLSLGGVARAAAVSPARRLSLINLHTGDTFNDAYWENGAYVPEAMGAINHVMRDHRSGDVHAIDPILIDLLVDLNGRIGSHAPFQIISGYRSPATNAAMHERSAGVASHSLHMDGKAIDVRVRGVELAHLRDTALLMRQGGVGYYPTSDFVHLDTGRVRRWSGS